MRASTAWGLRALGIAGLGAAAGLARAARGIPTAMGGTPSGERARRMAKSPHFRDGKFHNEDVVFEPSTRSLAGTAMPRSRSKYHSVVSGSGMFARFPHAGATNHRRTSVQCPG